MGYKMLWKSSSKNTALYAFQWGSEISFSTVSLEPDSSGSTVREKLYQLSEYGSSSLLETRWKTYLSSTSEIIWAQSQHIGPI